MDAFQTRMANRTACAQTHRAIAVSSMCSGSSRLHRLCGKLVRPASGLSGTDLTLGSEDLLHTWLCKMSS